ncbi:MAG: FtsX-like permease family protein, partial [Acidobacteria bacterium]
MVTLRLTLRRWMSRPIAAGASVASLALGIGVVAAAFSLADAILLRPFPFEDAPRLAYVWGSTDERVRRGLTAEAISALESSHAFETLSLFLPAVRVTVGLDPRDTTFAVSTDGNFLRVLGVRPLLGRGLREEVPTSDEQEVLVSFGAWQSLFAARRDIVGASVIIDGTKRTVVGVMPQGFYFPDATVQLWVPHRRTERVGHPGQMMFVALGRAPRGQTLAGVRAKVTAFLPRVGPNGSHAAPIGFFPLTEAAVRDYQQAVWWLTAASVALLLLVVANDTTNQLGRLHGRQSELAIRAALGATPGRLMRELVAEQFLTAVVSGLLGLLVASLCVALVRGGHFWAGSRIQDAEITRRTFVVGVGAVILVPLATFLGALAGRLNRQGGYWRRDVLNGAYTSPAGLRGVILFELAVAPTLLVAASMSFSTFVNAVTTDWGFEPSGSVMVGVRLPPAMGRRLGQQSEFTEAALRSISKLPNITAVGMGYRIPMAGGSWQRGLSVRVPGKLVGAEAGVEEHRISHGYFRALGTPIVQGREFTPADDVSHDLVAVISRTCARLLFGTENAVGRVIHVVREQADLSDVPEPLATELKSSVVGEVPRRIVGVVDDIRTSAIGGQFAPVIYTEYRQQDRGFWYGTLYPMFIVRAPTAAPVPVERVIATLREM